MISSMKCVGFSVRLSVLLGPNTLSVSVHGRQYDRAAEIEYGDGIWVGYRHFDTRNVDVAYPFGHGLSYTSFAHTDLILDRGSMDDVLSANAWVAASGQYEVCIGTSSRDIRQRATFNKQDPTQLLP